MIYRDIDKTKPIEGERTGRTTEECLLSSVFSTFLFSHPQFANLRGVKSMEFSNPMRAPILKAEKPDLATSIADSR